MKCALLIFLLAFSHAGSARSEEPSTEQIYNQLVFMDDKYSFELRGKPICGPGSIGFYCETESSKELFRLSRILEGRADSGDGEAAFYFGNLTFKRAESLANPSKNESSMKEYEKAQALYKKACLSKIYAGCWNVGSIYLNGLGEVRSGLAATEWFYKAGVGYIAIGERDRALAALELINGVDSKNELGKKLARQLKNSAEK